jgi:two-component system, OmpR family, phosphate regulon sensor histidine kinase PhoR
MKTNKAKIIVLLGLLAFVAIIVIQLFWLRQAYDFEQKKISQNIRVSLLDVANQINKYYGYASPLNNPVEMQRPDYYVVNMRNDFDARVLELILINTFKARGIDSRFEYAIYDCETDDMLYGNYITGGKAAPPADSSAYFPKARHLVYYFAVRFPQAQQMIYASLRGWMLLFGVMLITLFIYLYAIYIIWQQQKFAGLQQDFINNMSHEFKTPLSSILIAAQYLHTQHSTDGNERLQQYSSLIITQGNKLDGHLERILQLARHDGQPMQLKKETIHVQEYIQAAAAAIQFKYPKCTIHLHLPAPEAFINADAFHFGNVLYNLLDNAAKYCEQAPHIAIHISQPQQVLQIAIADNGIGIAPKYQQQIFSRFYRVPQPNSSAINGFGLGLYYVKKVCRLHGWKLTLNSTPKKGSTFTLHIKPLPAQHWQAQATTAPAIP